MHWAPSKVFEVKRSFLGLQRPHFWFHLVFTSFLLEFLYFWVSRSFDLGNLSDLRDFFFSKTTFLKSVHSKEKDKTFSSKFSLSLSKEEMWWCLIWTVSNKLLKSYECTLELYIFYFLWDKNLKNIPQMFCFSQKCTPIYWRRTKACCSGFGNTAKRHSFHLFKGLFQL